MRVLAYWFFVFFVLTCGVLNTHIPLTAIYNPSAAILVFALVPGIVLCQRGSRGTIAVLRRMLQQELLSEDFRLLDQVNAAAFLFSAVAMIVGMIHVMRILANPDAMGPGVAFAFVGLVCGALVPVLLLPFHNSFTARKLVRRAAVFAFLVIPACTGLTFFSMHVAKVI